MSEVNEHGKLVSNTDYKGFTLSDAAQRPGSLDVLKNPSRYGSKLHHPDGTYECDTCGQISRLTSGLCDWCYKTYEANK